MGVSTECHRTAFALQDRILVVAEQVEAFVQERVQPFGGARVVDRVLGAGAGARVVGERLLHPFPCRDFRGRGVAGCDEGHVAAFGFRHGLAVFMVEGPFAANGLAVVVHQDVQPLALPCVEVRHEPALAAIAVFAVELGRVEEGGGVEGFQLNTRFIAGSGEALFEHEVVQVGNDNAGRAILRAIGHRAGEQFGIVLVVDPLHGKTVLTQPVRVGRHGSAVVGEFQLVETGGVLGVAEEQWLLDE